MRKKYLSLLILFCLTILTAFPVSGKIAFANDNIVFLGGYSAGFSVETKGAEILGLTEVITDKGLVSPSKNAGLKVGDVIYSIDGVEVNNALDIEKTLNDCKEKLILIRRGDDEILININPAMELNGKIKIGVFIRDQISGIGTVTFIKNEQFASLGHPIIDNNNKIEKIAGGTLCGARILGVVKGEKGVPGEIKGNLISNLCLGQITKNTESGVYGKISDSYNKKSLIPIEVGQGVIGKAKIICEVDNLGKKEYDISIVKADTIFQSETKNFVIKIDDKELIEKTGGIVQGMSGSPIIQDNKIVGAVTHVFINDPLRGYGISISNMLKEID